MRLAFVIGGVLVFGILYGLLLRPGLNPNPPSSTRVLLQSLLVQGRIVPAVAGMLIVIWCRFLCPFGLLSWVVEQGSRFRPRINRAACKKCQACVRACPSGAMADFYADKRLHTDCFACGACIEACPVEDALGWRAPQ